MSLLPNACTDIILGHDFIGKHSELRIPFLGNRPPLVVCGVAAANVESPALFANLDAQCKPIATKSRRHSKQDNKFISSEIEQLLRNGIIEKSNSPWRAQVLVTTNENHKRRMVVDYSQTINRYTYLDAYPQKQLHEMIENVSQFKMFSALDLKSAYHQIPLRNYEKPYTAFEANGNLYQFKRIPFGVTNGVSCFQRIIDDIISKEKLSGTFAYIDNVTICGNDSKSHDENLKQFMKAAEKYGITFNDSKSIIGVEEINMLGYRVSKGTIRPDPERFESLRNMKPPTSPKSLQRIIGLFSYYSQWISHFSDKIRPLSLNEKFPLTSPALSAFENLKCELESAVLVTVDQKRPLVLETDASDVAIAATLNQDGRPVAFFSRTLNSSEKNHSAVEKEAYAIVEAIRKWTHYLINSQFTLVTDQKSVSFIFDKGQRGKIKNDKIQRWRIELSPYSYDIVHRPGSENHAPDALSRCCSLNSGSAEDLNNLHAAMCHPGVVRMIHYVRSKNLPYSTSEVKSVVSKCPVCAELKPRFYKPDGGTLIKATQPFERLSIDFKGPLPSSSRNKYLLTIIDEYSRFPFAFPCSDMSSATVINCLITLFSLFGTPQYLHSDRGTSFISKEIQDFLRSKGIVSSRSTPYNPQGNGQVERLNGTLWRTITLALKTQNLDLNKWELVLQHSLHCIRSLLCTETNSSPHERMFQHQRRSSNGNSLPTWLLSPGRVYLKRSVRSSKYDPLVDEVELLEANPLYAYIRLNDGRESTVSLRQLAPMAETGSHDNDHRSHSNECETSIPQTDSSNVEMLEATNNSIEETESPIAHEETQPIVHEEIQPIVDNENRRNSCRSQGFIRTNPYSLRSGPK